MIRYYDTDRCCYHFASEGALKKFLKEHAELYFMAASLVAAYSSSAYYCFFTDVLGNIKVGVTEGVVPGITIINICLPQRTE